VTFCYFPITFRPPPDDPYGITSEHLKIGLRDCLSATPYFAKFALPLLLEKLSSSSGSAKVRPTRDQDSKLRSRGVTLRNVPARK